MDNNNKHTNKLGSVGDNFDYRIPLGEEAYCDKIKMCLSISPFIDAKEKFTINKLDY